MSRSMLQYDDLTTSSIIFNHVLDFNFDGLRTTVFVVIEHSNGTAIEMVEF